MLLPLSFHSPAAAAAAAWQPEEQKLTCSQKSKDDMQRKHRGTKWWGKNRWVQAAESFLQSSQTIWDCWMREELRGLFFSFSVWLHILQRQGYSNYSEFPLLPFQRRLGQTGINPSVESENTDGLQLSSTANEATLVTLPWRNISADISLTLNC